MISFLRSYVAERSIPPQSFYFTFEVKRLMFTHYGTLKGMNHKRVTMLLSLLILVRVLIYKLILRPWEMLPSLKKTEVLRRNIKTVGSFLYHLVYDHLVLTVIVVSNNPVSYTHLTLPTIYSV
eukprot:TRINITY_DN8634_c0_g1_i7.p1 TRINITY_DN8634_c0_g1~~TRINITY_DN8634_c0_g1_i7.p1  ORF type:complete len:123 (-),score=8.75 TRINITY_DN8634_c0_g1_i7:34-402(-)